MAAYREGSPDENAFREEVVRAGYLIESGVAGVYGRGQGFEEIRVGVDRAVTLAATVDGGERLRFPPVIPRKQLEAIGYLKSFPHLAGTIFSFDGDEEAALAQEQAADRGEDWSGYQEMTDLVLVPAACYPVYPAIAARGPLPAGGVVVDAGGSWVFRNEPAGDPARMQMFHQREMVRLGEPEAVADWREAWRDRAVALLRDLGLDADFAVASDPFFGRAGRMLARNQRAAELKFEILVPIAGEEPTAVASFNYHQDHFSSIYDLRTSTGDVAHTACLGFGLERITLALLRKHGLDTEAWPDPVRGKLWGPA
ncbi:MAG: amino acid--[acyl-carrier-protein] ligase [Solirubrobacteraceae bacterium]